MSDSLPVLEQLVIGLGRRLPGRLKQRMRIVAQHLLLTNVQQARSIQPKDLIYPYGSDKFAVAYIATVAGDVSLIEQCVDLLNPGKAIPVICHVSELAEQFSHPKIEVIAYEDFARRGIPVAILVNGSFEVEVETRCRDIWKRFGSKFTIYDPYQPSDVVSAPTLRRYRDVTLHLEPSTLFPTIYSNWDYINILLNEIGSGTGDVLDMFAGSGVIGFSLKREAPIRSITFCDVNYWAIRSMRRTMAEDPSLSGNVWLSEGLTGIPAMAMFDLIVGNPPHSNVPLNGPRTLPGADPHWEAHDLFFRDAYKHLRPSGRILLIESKSADVYDQYYKHLQKNFPQYRLGRYIDQPNHICFVTEVLLA